MSRLLFFLVSALPLFGQEAFFHVSKAGNGFETKLVVESRGTYESAPFIYLVKAYSEQGSLLSESSILVRVATFQPRLRAIAMGYLSENRELISHFSIKSTRTPVEENTFCYVSYEASSGTGEPVTIGPSFKKAHEWQLFPSNWNTTADGIAIINCGSDSTEVKVQQVDYLGNVLATIVIDDDLVSFGKTTFIIGGPGNTPFLAQQDSLFRIISQPSEVFVVSIKTVNTESSQYLWVNHVTPVFPVD